MMHDDDLSGGSPALNMDGRTRLDGGGGSELRFVPTAILDGAASVEEGKAQLVQAGASSRLLVPTSDGNIYLPCESIIRLEAEGSYTHIHTQEGERHLTCKGIGVLQKQLPVAWFHRCHRTHVINLMKVRKLLRTGGHRAELLSGDIVEVSRRKWQELLNAMGSLRS
jgi:DNA-binding LytR/AlgR family response regulator